MSIRSVYPPESPEDASLLKGIVLSPGSNYRSGLTFKKISATQPVYRLPGIKTGRTHILAGSVRRAIIAYAEIDPNVVDIQEAYPLLPLGESRLLAAELHIPHPSSIVRTDVLLHLRHSGHQSHDVAVEIASTGEASPTSRALQLKTSWWDARGTPTALVHACDFHPTVLGNLWWLRGALRTSSTWNTAARRQTFADAFTKRWCRHQSTPLAILCTEAASALNIAESVGLQMFHLSVWHGDLAPDLRDQTLNLGSPIRCISHPTRGLVYPWYS